MGRSTIVALAIRAQGDDFFAVSPSVHPSIRPTGLTLWFGGDGQPTRRRRDFHVCDFPRHPAPIQRASWS